MPHIKKKKFGESVKCLKEGREDGDKFWDACILLLPLIFLSTHEIVTFGPIPRPCPQNPFLYGCPLPDLFLSWTMSTFIYLFIYYSSSSKLTIINKANHYYKYSFFPSFPQFFLFFLWNRYKYVLYSSNVNFFMDDIHRSTCVSVKRVW